jgi:hypothetical protein
MRALERRARRVEAGAPLAVGTLTVVHGGALDPLDRRRLPLDVTEPRERERLVHTAREPQGRVGGAGKCLPREQARQRVTWLEIAVHRRELHPGDGLVCSEFLFHTADGELGARGHLRPRSQRRIALKRARELLAGDRRKHADRRAG